MNRSYHFPFVVHSQGVGTFTYLNSEEKCFRTEINGKRFEFTQPLSYFLERNAKNNPDNDPKKDYYISQGYGPEPKESKLNKFGRDESRGRYGFATGGFISEAMIDCGEIAQAKIYDRFPFGGEMLASKVDFKADSFTILGGHDGKTAVVRMGDLRTNEEKLQSKIDALTGELAAANETIQKVREALRTQEGEDVRAHAKVLRQMADALVKLWRNE